MCKERGNESLSKSPKGLRERIRDKFEDISLCKEVQPYLINREDTLHLQEVI